MRRRLQLLLAILGPCLCVPVLGQAHWLTMAGDLTTPQVDTVEVSPDSVTVFKNLRVMKIRTNRAANRITYDGLPYRSYHGTVHIDCDAKQARFRQMRYFLGPLWTGEARNVEYPEGDMPPVAFRDLNPNPVARIVQAACAIGTVQSR